VAVVVAVNVVVVVVVVLMNFFHAHKNSSLKIFLSLDYVVNFTIKTSL
jgi:hypothetical protein